MRCSEEQYERETTIHESYLAELGRLKTLLRSAHDRVFTLEGENRRLKEMLQGVARLVEDGEQTARATHSSGEGETCS